MCIRDSLRWTIFQVLIGNSDAHAKNLSFYYDKKGLVLTPAYDMICVASYHGNQANGEISAGMNTGINDEFAMSIGDAFTAKDLCALEWAEFAHLCNLPQKLVASEISRMCLAIQSREPELLALARTNHINDSISGAVLQHTLSACDTQLQIAKQIAEVSPDMLSAPRIG